jgi:nitrogen fixation NifU-like protein
MEDKSNGSREKGSLSDEQEMTAGPILFYNQVVMEHFTHPRNVGEMSDDEADGFSISGDPECGDQLFLWIKVKNNIIVDIRFKSFGCPGAIATSSMMTVLVKGKSLEEAKKLTDDDVVEALEGIPDRKKHCSLLGVSALQEAIKNFENKYKEL